MSRYFRITQKGYEGMMEQQKTEVEGKKQNRFICGLVFKWTCISS